MVSPIKHVLSCFATGHSCPRSWWLQVLWLQWIWVSVREWLRHQRQWPRVRCCIQCRSSMKAMPWMRNICISSSKTCPSSPKDNLCCRCRHCRHRKTLWISSRWRRVWSRSQSQTVCQRSGSSHSVWSSRRFCRTILSSKCPTREKSPLPNNL